MTHRDNRAAHRCAVSLTSIGAALLLVLWGSACATPVGVYRVSLEQSQLDLTANVLSTGQPSAFSQQYLRRLNLGELYEYDPAAALEKIQDGITDTRKRNRLFALSELSFAHARDSGNRDYFLAAAVYAYAFLFPADQRWAPVPYDPRLRVAMDLYNRGLAYGLASQGGHWVDLRPRTAKVPFGTLEITPDTETFWWGHRQVQTFASMANYKIRGLRNRYRRPGIGAPLAASTIAVPGISEDSEKWLAPNIKVPVTAFLRLPKVREQILSGHVHGRIELFSPDRATSVGVDGYTVPLEYEPSAVLAYRLEGAPVWDTEILGFRSGDFDLTGGDKTLGLYMVEPYQRGLIPVVFVHGTASSPARWAEMANEITGDTTLGPRYQIWVFTYNSGNPVAYSASRLRQALTEAVATLDPQGTDPALQEMVVIGHSQGGLLTKMTVVDSGDKFWDLLSPVPFDKADLDDDARALLQATAFIKPLPFVKEVVFIATPHHGSFLADNILGTIARKLVRVPSTITRTTMQLVRLHPVTAASTALAIPTSIDNMNWSNPFLRTLASLPIAPGVIAHSIIPVRGDGPKEEGDDGVVDYTSAHIDGVASELVVRDGHSTQATPETIEEVRRILTEHLKDDE